MPLGSGSFSLITPFLLPLVLFSAGILLAGILALRPRTRRAAVAAELAAHAASWIAVFVYAAIWIPRARKILQDFGIELSNLSMLVIQIADLMADPAVMAIVTASLLAADGIIYSLLWRSDFSPSTRRRFSIFMTLVPLLVMLLFETAIIVPLFKLTATLA
jgi:hypothetical protein